MEARWHHVSSVPKAIRVTCEVGSCGFIITHVETNAPSEMDEFFNNSCPRAHASPGIFQHAQLDFVLASRVTLDVTRLLWLCHAIASCLWDR